MFLYSLYQVETYHMKPFHGLKISFLGFSDEDSEHMNEITLQNGNALFCTASFCNDKQFSLTNRY